MYSLVLVGRLVNNELEVMWKEAVVAERKVFASGD
jgi:hypothetical protein